MKKVLFIALLSLFQGCLNLNGHIEEIKGNKGISTIYEATESVWNEAICIWWKDNPNDPDGYIKEFVKLSYPYWVIDLPFEAIFDTITLPYDLCVMLTRKEEEQSCPKKK